MKILITGKNGQLAQALLHHARGKCFNLLGFTKKECDITNPAQLKKIFAEIKPEVVINTAAFTAVDAAEKQSKEAMNVNYRGSLHLAKLCTLFAIPLLHISTDYVFNGIKATPYLETDPIDPLNSYGKSKALGEQAIMQYAKQYIILRVSGIFSPYQNNFVKTILKRAQERLLLKVVADQITCPTGASDIASVLFILAQNAHKASGIYHFASIPPVSWYQFATAIIKGATLYGLKDQEIEPTRMHDHENVCKRPALSILDCQKIKKTFGITQPDWQISLNTVLHQLLQDKNANTL